MSAVASKIAVHKGRTVGRRRKPMSKEVRRTIAGKFGLRLETLVFESGLTVKEFADKIGKGEDSVRTYFRGSSMPPIQDLPRIVKVLGLNSVRDLFPDGV